MNRALLALAALGVFGVATQASAHARLMASDPAAGATVAAPKQLTLHFSEKLNPTFSGLTLTMPRSKNMAVAAKVSVGKDGRSLVATPSEPLKPGAYTVNWRSVSADTHRVKGSYGFTVK